MSGYEWVKIDGPSDYDELAKRLDADYAPKAVVAKLKLYIKPTVRGVLIEKGYIDKDYRSTFYKHYAKKGRLYRDDCVRLHFFAVGVDFDEATTDLKSATGDVVEDQYFGFIVLRPTIVATIGRSILSPSIRKAASGRAIQAKHKVHLLGHTLPVWGFPSMSQHADISVCAHVSCWSILRYYSERFSRYPELLLHDITMMASQFDPGGVAPGLGLEITDAERIFQAAGTYPLIVGKKKGDEDRFYAQMLSYLESGFPLFVALTIKGEGHAIVAAGYSWKAVATPPPYDISNAWLQVDSILAVDDNLLPYGRVAVDPVETDGSDAAEASYLVMNFIGFIVALPEKIFYPAAAVEDYSVGALYPLLSANLDGMPAEDDMLRRYFITSVSSLREYARARQSQFGDELVNILMRLNTAQFVWVVEYASYEQWNNGHIAARAIIDATASPGDPDPVWLAHDNQTALLFDRSEPYGAITAVKLNRPVKTPLGRMEINLRSIPK